MPTLSCKHAPMTPQLTQYMLFGCAPSSDTACEVIGGTHLIRKQPVLTSATPGLCNMFGK